MFECDREASTKRMPWPTRGSRSIEEGGGDSHLITLVFNCLIMASVVVTAENRNRILPNTKQNG